MAAGSQRIGKRENVMRACRHCGILETDAMLAYRGAQLVCADCDADLESAWVREDPENNRHYPDTFGPND